MTPAQLAKSRSVMLLKALKRDKTLYFWFNPDGGDGTGVLLIEKEENLLSPKTKRAQRKVKAKEKSCEGTVALVKGKVVFNGEGSESANKVKQGIKALASDPDWKAVKGKLEKPTVVIGGETADKDTDEDSTEDAPAADTEAKALKERWKELTGRVQGQYIDAKARLGDGTSAFKAIKDLKDKAFATKKSGDLAGGIKQIEALEVHIKEALRKTEQISAEEWEQIKQMGVEAYTTASRVLPKTSLDWGELVDLQKKAVQAKRSGDLQGSVGFFRNLVDKAQAAIKAVGKGPSLEEWDAVKDEAQAEYMKLMDVSGPGEPAFDVIESQRRTAVELRKRDDLGSSIKLFKQMIENIRITLTDIASVAPELGRLDWGELAAAFKLAKRRKKHSWFWFCREGADGNPVLFIERKEELMRVRGKAALRTARKKKSLSGWITKSEGGDLEFWGEGSVPLPQAEKDFAQKLTKIEELSAIGPQLRAVVWRDADDALERPEDVEGDEDELEPETEATEPSEPAVKVSFVNLQKARLEWDGARKLLASHITSLQGKLLDVFPNEKQTVDALSTVLDTYDAQLLDQLDAALNAEGNEREAHHRTAKATLGRYKSTISDDKLLAHLDKSKYIDASLVRTVADALSKVEAQIAR